MIRPTPSDSSDDDSRRQPCSVPDFAAPSAADPVAGIAKTKCDGKFFKLRDLLRKRNDGIEDGGIAMNRLN